MSKRFRKQSHTIYECKYHLICVSKVSATDIKASNSAPSRANKTKPPPLAVVILLVGLSVIFQRQHKTSNLVYLNPPSYLEPQFYTADKRQVCCHSERRSALCEV